MIKKTQDFLVKQKTTVKEVMRYCSKTGQKQVFVVDKAGCLVGAISDGDIRRWILKGGSLDETVGKVCNQAPTTITSNYDTEYQKDPRNYGQPMIGQNVYISSADNKMNKLKQQFPLPMALNR